MIEDLLQRMCISEFGPPDPGRSDKAEGRHDGSSQRTGSSQHGGKGDFQTVKILSSAFLLGIISYMRCCDKAILD